MLCKTARAVAIVTALFLCPSPSKGMEHCTNDYSSYKDIEKNTSTFNSLEDILGKTYKTVNQNLKEIVSILEAKLKTDSHTITSIKDQKEINQCKLAALSSPLISGNGNKPLRDDLRTLLYKPWTDRYYGEHLSQKDFTLLFILRDAIAVEPFFEGQGRTTLSLERVLSCISKDKIQINLMEGNAYPDLFIRRRLDEINKLFGRCGMIRDDGIADLYNIPDLDQNERWGIQMTLSKAYMMHMLNRGDGDRIVELEGSLLRWDAFKNRFDTYTQRRFLDIFFELGEALKTDFSIQEKISHCLSGVDLKWLNDRKHNPERIDEQPFLSNVRDLVKELETFLNRQDYLSFLPLYQERPFLRSQHRGILTSILTKLPDDEKLADLFTELSQLKVAINCLGNEKLRSVLGLTQGISDLSPEGKADWLNLQENVRKIKGKIGDLQWQILLRLEKKKEDFVDGVISLLQEKEDNKRKKTKMNLKKSEIWILAMDGGGVRGKIAAEILRDLSYRLKARGIKGGLSTIFDLVAGTSVGGLIALALNLPDENDEPALDEDYIATLLEKEKGSIIFPSIHWLYKYLSQGNSNAYDADSLENLLLANLGYTPLSDLIVPTVVIAHSNRTQRPVVINSWDSASEEITAMGGARSTTAASTYFPPSTQFYDGELEEFIDGGLTGNCPAFYALHEYLKLRNFNEDGSLKRINILSIGTGCTEYSYTHGTSKTGLPGVIKGLQEGTMEQVIRDAHGKVILSLGGLMKDKIKVNYYLLNPELENPIELDSANEKNISKLRTVFKKSISKSPFYEQLGADLAGDPNIPKNRYVEIRGKFSDRSEEFFPDYPYLESMKGNKKTMDIKIEI